MALERQVFLKGKLAVDAGGNAAGDLRRLDDDGARAAARVVQRHALLAQPAFAAPAAGGQHGGGQRFLQRRIALVLAPAALEQRLARGVDVNRHRVGGQVDIHAHVGPAGVDAGAHVVELVAKAVGNRVLDLQRGKVQALQRAVLGGDLDLEGLLRRKPHLPGHAAGNVVQVFLRAVGRMRQLHQHALRQPAVQVQQQRVAPRGAQQHAAAPSEQVFTGQPGVAVHLVGQETLDASGAGQKKLELIHGFMSKKPRGGRCLGQGGKRASLFLHFADNVDREPDRVAAVRFLRTRCPRLGKLAFRLSTHPW